MEEDGDMALGLETQKPLPHVPVPRKLQICLDQRGVV